NHAHAKSPASASTTILPKMQLGLLISSLFYPRSAKAVLRGSLAALALNAMLGECLLDTLPYVSAHCRQALRISIAAAQHLGRTRGWTQSANGHRLLPARQMRPAPEKFCGPCRVQREDTPTFGGIALSRRSHNTQNDPGLQGLVTS